MPTSALGDMEFKCGVPSGNDNPMNTEANAEQPAGTHNPYEENTSTPGPSPNTAGRRKGNVSRVGEVGFVGMGSWMGACVWVGCVCCVKASVSS